MKIHLPTKIIFGILALLIVVAAVVLTIEYPKLKKQQASTNSDITVSWPLDAQAITSPITVTGKVKSSWVYEGSFPVQILDQDGTVLAEFHVPVKTLPPTDLNSKAGTMLDFSATIAFNQPKGTKGTIVFSNDSPLVAAKDHKEFRLNVSFNPLAEQNGKTCAPELADCGGDAALCMKNNKNVVCN